MSDAFDYGNVVDNYIGTHALPGIVLAGLNAAEAENLVASVEREIFSGDTTNASSTASPFSFDPNLPNAVHDFRVGTLDVDVETGTVDTAPTENGTNVDLESGANYGYDATGLDDSYDPWAYQYNGGVRGNIRCANGLPPTPARRDALRTIRILRRSPRHKIQVRVQGRGPWMGSVRGEQPLASRAAE